MIRGSLFGEANHETRITKDEMADKSSKIIIILGPTASGKTEIGSRLCRDFDGEIVSADSQQVYTGMDIGTAKEDLTGRGIKTHLIDIVSPDQPFDAAQFKTDADRVITGISGRKKLPVVVGGTGFYIKVLLEGLSDAPGRDEKIRTELLEIMEENGAAALHDLLKTEDPLAADRLSENDYIRVIRALEVKRLTGRSITELGKKENRRDYETLKIGLNLDRELLYERINERVEMMLSRGLVEEVKGLVSLFGYDIESLRAVGYKEIVGYIKGEIDLEEAIRLTKRNSRRFAKRQMTWFRADPGIEWFSTDEYDLIRKVVESFLSQ